MNKIPLSLIGIVQEKGCKLDLKETLIRLILPR